MESDAIFKRVGTVLLIVGLIDIAVMIGCIVAGVSYSSSLNIFAVVAGIFLLRGSLRAASVVRRASVFLLAAFCSALVAVPFMQPLDLTFTQVRLNLWSFFIAGIVMILMFGLLLWVSKELGRHEVDLAFSRAGMTPPNTRTVAVTGAGFVIALATLLSFFLAGGESIKRATRLAEQEVGSGYRFHVRSLNVSLGAHGKKTRATVVGWNDREIRDIRVEWSE